MIDSSCKKSNIITCYFDAYFIVNIVYTLSDFLYVFFIVWNIKFLVFYIFSRNSILDKDLHDTTIIIFYLA